MFKHKLVCFLVGLLVFVGGLNWGLVGLGHFLGGNWNVVNLLLGSMAWLENVVYLVVGLAALAHGFFLFTCGEKCGCNSCGKM